MYSFISLLKIKEKEMLQDCTIICVYIKIIDISQSDFIKFILFVCLDLVVISILLSGFLASQKSITIIIEFILLNISLFRCMVINLA